MKTDMAWTSLLAYEQLVATGKDKTMRARILKYVIDHPGKTRNELALRLSMRLASVCGRANELVAAGLLVEDGTRMDAVTGHQNKILMPFYGPAPDQREMF